MRVRYFYPILLLSLTGIFSQAQTVTQPDSSSDTRPTNMFSTGLGIQHGFIFAHSARVENTKGSNPTGIEMILSWQRNDPMIWNLCNCYPRRGLLLSYYDYDNKVLGKGLTAAYFLEPVYKLGKKTFFSFRASGGFSYLTNPFDSVRHPNNRSYSTKMNAYLLVGLGVWIRLSDHWWLNPSLNYNHESNGGMKQPNAGINWPTAGITLSYQKDKRAYYTGMRSREKFWTHKTIRWDIGTFGTLKRALDPQGNSLRLPLIGVSFQAGKQVGRINMLSIGTEVFKDWALRHQLKQDTIAASHMKVGILAGHEFILGKFLFSQKLGFYVFDQTPDFDQLYHRWGLSYRVNRRFAVGVNLSAHRHIADFTDLKLTYSIQEKY
jgi:hypothetical protein